MKRELMESMTLKQFAELQGLSTILDDMLRRISIADSNSFVESVETDLECIFRELESGAKVREKDGEDRLTAEVIQGMRLLGYDATHDENYNGHSDIVVKWKQNVFTWLGEAKVHNGYDYLWDGFLQLSTRYSSGSSSCDCGGMIVYIRNFDAASVMKSWNNELNGRTFDDGTGVKSRLDSSNPLRLRSSHQHKRSGMAYRVRHFGIVLSVGPEDKSARISRAKKSTRTKRKRSAGKD